MRILILNQYFPPDPAPTGSLLADVAGALRERGHEVTCLGAPGGYHDPGRFQSRMKREARALGSLLKGAMTASRAELIISSSSPPCLALAGALAALRHRARSLHWALDLYPDLAVTLGEIRPGPLSATIAALMRLAYRRSEVVSVDADMAQRLASQGVASVPIRPWIPESPVPEGAATTPRRTPFRWLYSGNLGRAHEWETLLEAQALLEGRSCPATLVFQGRGGAREAAKRRAGELGLRQVEFSDYAAPEAFAQSLLEAGALVATQRPETLGMLWPSKLAMLAAVPRPFLWIGPRQGSVARETAMRGDGRVFSPGEAAELAGRVERLSQAPDGSAKLNREMLESARSAALAQWIELVERQPQKKGAGTFVSALFSAG